MHSVHFESSDFANSSTAEEESYTNSSQFSSMLSVDKSNLNHVNATTQSANSLDVEFGVDDGVQNDSNSNEIDTSVSLNDIHYVSPDSDEGNHKNLSTSGVSEDTKEYLSEKYNISKIALQFYNSTSREIEDHTTPVPELTPQTLPTRKKTGEMTPSKRRSLTRKSRTKYSKKSLDNSNAKPEAVMQVSPPLVDSRARLSSDYDSQTTTSSSTTKRTISLKRYNVTATPKRRVTTYNSSYAGVRVFPKHSIVRTGNSPTGSVCFDDPCGIEIACSPQGDGFICICSDGTEVSPGKSCPINKPVNYTPPAIPIEEPEQIIHSHSYVWGLAMTSAIFFIVVAFSSIVFWKRRKIFNILRNMKTKDHFEKEDTLTKSNPLNLMTFANNPNYNDSSSNNSPTNLNLLSSHLISKDQIHIIGDLGEGCFGKVYKAEYGPKTHGIEEPRTRTSSIVSNGNGGNSGTSWDKRIVAVKVLKRPFGPESHADFLREANIVSMFEHPNILSLIGIVLTENLVPWMVFEFMPYGDLTEVLRSYDDFISYTAPKKTVNLTDLLDILVDIASGMDFLSRQHYVHRDLACRNCLVGEDLVVKISDFGMCRDVYTSDYYTVNGSPMVPVRWMPPESILYGKFTFESDVWSFGVVAWEVFSFAKQPYYGLTNEQAVKFILEGYLLKPPPISPKHVLEIMHKCWKKQPHHRPTFEHTLSLLQTARAIAVLNNGEFPKVAEDVQYTLLSSSTNKIPVDSDEYLLPSPTHQREYLSFVSSLFEQNASL